ncbi:hypothetical protein MBAV_001891 [Candidatus Magnetobacterium bavaricum]|uniref:Uncharacterized protein n=1 Tax=Candidatus Magnetobacterium bavaricum TaxID=29290 RepID=A0A0F3GVL0_9BACT|nr:hypothetical protein MBAV_001891 [Candidatus Magnetobacterium bavaricum]
MHDIISLSLQDYPDVVGDDYWTSTDSDIYDTFVIGMSSGFVSSSSRTYPNSVWPVRSGQ